MGIVQQLYSNRNRVKQAFLGHRVVFHHVPKCAGTSVSRALRLRYFLSEESIAAPGTAQVIDHHYGSGDFGDLAYFNEIRQFRIKLLHYMMWKDIYFIGGHVPFNNKAHAHLGAGYRFITVLRDPVERFLSEYFYNKGRAHQSRIDESLADYIDSPLGQRNALKFCEYFSGATRLDLSYPEKLKQDAIENLRHFHLIGFTEDMSKFQENIKSTLGVRVSFGQENQRKTPPSQVAEQVTTEIHNKIRKMCRYDQEIYDAAKRMRSPIVY